MAAQEILSEQRVRTAEVIAALSLATDLGTGLPLEHGLHSTVVAMRLAERLGVDDETARQTYYTCLLVYVGCTADAHVASDLFDHGSGNSHDSLAEHFTPVMFGSPGAAMAGVARALAPPGAARPARVARVARKLPSAARSYRHHLVALCEVAEILTDRLGLPASVSTLFATMTERWDGKGQPGRARGDEIPLPVRIAHVARDAAFQQTLGGDEHAARVVGERAGHAFDPAVAEELVQACPEILALEPDQPAWDAVLECEPAGQLGLEGEAIDRALRAMADFADLVSAYLAGHSSGVAGLAAAAGARCGLDPATLRRAGLVHDLGRVAVPARIWQKPAALVADEWERVRLHAYHSERVLARSGFLGALAPVATAHHERLDGSGYHRGVSAAALPLPARVLAAADAYSAMTEPRPHRPALSPAEAARELARETSEGRLDAGAVGAVLEAAGQRVPPMDRPAGLTEREAVVVGLLARGLQTKQVARTLGISAKTADRHVQNSYAKIGVSTRAAATLFAMEHGLTAWGELPMGDHGAAT